MAEAAVTFLLEQVKEVVKEHVYLISGSETEFELLVNALDLLKAIVQDMGKPKQKNNLYRELERQIREVVYEIGDAIDTTLSRAIQIKAKNSRMSKFLSSRSFSFTKEVRSIREGKVLPLLDKAKSKYSSLIADQSAGMEGQRTITEKDAPIRRTRDVVGFGDQVDMIIHSLMKEGETLDVIPIVGIPGQGKTTLASLIYMNTGHNFSRIWISISEQLNVSNVFLHILRELIPNVSHDTLMLEDNELAHVVSACLKKVKFLLVLDNVRSIDAWNAIKEVLPFGNGKSKVLITTPAMDVGMHVSGNPHKMKFLTDVESMELLRYQVFGSLDCPTELSAIGEQIAIRCEGVPLTILVIGGILAHSSLEEWETVLKHESDVIKTNKVQSITDAVALSYDKLPDDLRECFLYLGIFPQDYEIPVQMLCNLWISEGFILPDHGRYLEECAEHKLNNLIARNLLTVEKTNNMGKAKTCRVPRLIHAFCIAMSSEENLFQEIKESPEPPLSEMYKSPRLCFHSTLSLSNFLSKKPCGPHVRSFLCFYDQPLALQAEAIPHGFPKLRVLFSNSIIFPPKLTQLIHLRYLTLYIDTLVTLPHQIAYLWNLEALIVETRSHFITMEANMWRMMKLRYLNTKASIILDNEWEGQAGHNLHTLNRLSPESCTEAVYNRAKNLKTLGISGNLGNLFGKNFLQKLLHLEKLKLVNTVTFEATSDDVLRLPQLNCFPPYLKRLTLMKTSLDWQHMSTLAMITSLEVLKLKDNAFVGLEWNVTGYNFPNLQLLFIGITDLVIWKCSPDSFPGLRVVVLKKCESLIKIPQCVGYRLEKLDIESLCKTAVESAREINNERKGIPPGKFAVPFVFKQCPACENM